MINIYEVCNHFIYETNFRLNLVLQETLYDIIYLMHWTDFKNWYVNEVYYSIYETNFGFIE